MPWHATTFETEGTHGSILGHYIVCGRSFHVKHLLPFMACMSLSISFHDNPPIISLSLSLLSKFFKLPRLCSHTGERAYWLFWGPHRLRQACPLGLRPLGECYKCSFVYYRRDPSEILPVLLIYWATCARSGASNSFALVDVRSPGIHRTREC